MRRAAPLLLAASIAAAALAAPMTTVHAADGAAASFSATVGAVEALPYQAAYLATGTDSAFSANATPVVNTPPADDYTAGSIPGSDPTGATDAPPWPPTFAARTITSTDGALLHGMVALHAGRHPGVVVAHGFNTHGNVSVIRWAAMLAANGWNVAAFDQRDFSAEAGEAATTPQTFGWKEAQDIITAGAWLKSQPGVTAVGVVGFSEGAQNTVLAISRDSAHVFRAALTFSGPADQDSQVYSTAVPPQCSTPACTYPVTEALVTAVVPPYTTGDPCAVLSAAAKAYGTTAYQILVNESALHAQTSAAIPLLNFYSQDDSLVQPFNATMMDAYEQGNPLQRTVLIQHGEHAYFFDRWWQQSAILTYFHALLPTDQSITTTPTVNQTAGGSALSSQTVNLGTPSRRSADSMLSPYICDTTQPPPGMQTAQPQASVGAGAPPALAGLGVAAVSAWRRRRSITRRCVSAAGAG
ncbi:MAG TPA: hypothetical protein VH661_03115 [Candidatus Dormibacteraeota bacterium]|nr:hypothetical protein [Candidatus Dormibacteraeota bacterium]